jgi:hypothetical protein
VVGAQKVQITAHGKGVKDKNTPQDVDIFELLSFRKQNSISRDTILYHREEREMD